MDPVLIAHAGHWLVNILYAAPLIVVGVSIVISIRRQRREGAAREPEPPSA